jgi:nuclear pore complex protein Nup98-Nup96
MTTYELQRVKNFSIRNPHGKVTFHGFTDVANLDLDTIVRLSKNSFEIYPDEAMKPPVGEKLNKAAIISLYGIEKPSSVNEEHFAKVV